MPNSARHSPIRIVTLILCAVAVRLAWGAPATGPSAREITSIEGVTEYRLANGLQVLLYPDEASSTISVNMTYRVGSRHESYGETGMAHLLEHMNFKGTPSHPHIPQEISSHGASANATTSYDRTNFFETFPAAPENLDWALGLEADRMIHSFIARKDLDSEMTVVRNEFERGENSPNRILEERVLETAFLWHNYGHPTIGARADIEGVPITRLQDFYHLYYQPDNATLIVAGNFDRVMTLKTIERLYGPIPKPTRILPNFYTAEPPQDGEREVTLSRAGGQKLLMEAYHIPADAHPDSPALGLLAQILNDRPSSRLYKRLVETKLAISASSSADTLHDPGWMMFTAVTPKDGDIAAVRSELNKVVSELATQPFTAEELSRALSQQLLGYERLLNSSQQVSAVLSENVSVGDWRLMFWDRDQMKKVTLDDLKRVAATYLIPSNRTVGEFLPVDHAVRADIGATPDVTAMLKDYKGETAKEAGEHFDPTPANIEARTHRASIGIIKTAYLEKKTRGDRVDASLSFHFGTVQALQNRGTVGRLVPLMLMRGTRLHTRQQLEDELTRLKASMNIGGDAAGVSVRIETTRENLAAVLRLAAEILQQPTFPADQLDEIKRGQLTGIENSRTDPQTLAQLAADRHVSAYPPTDFRYVATLDERMGLITKVTADDLKSFHQAFYGAGAAEVAIVGSFDATATTKLIGELFGSWKSGAPYERAPSELKAAQGTSETIATPDKPNAVYFALTSLKLRDDDADYPALIVGDTILGGGFLNSRLATRIRQQDGLSYTVSSQLGADSLDSVGSFSIFAICAPQNMAKVERDAQEELARVLVAPFTPAEVATAKSGILQSRKVGRATDGALAGQLARHLFLGRDFTWDARFERQLDAVTAQDVEKALRGHLDPKTMITVKAGDFSKSAQ
jgi:zinc protease